MIGGGDEEKMKKTKNIILYVIIGIVIMWLAYAIVNWTIRVVTNPAVAQMTQRIVASIIPETHAAYTESERDTFMEYSSRLQAAIEELEAEFRIHEKVQVSSLQNVKNLVQLAHDRLPDKDPAAASQNESAKRAVDMYLDLAIKDPNSKRVVSEAISNTATYIRSAKIERVEGTISATPTEGNAPLAVSLRANGIKDPSGTTPPSSNYIWWIRENG